MKNHCLVALSLAFTAITATAQAPSTDTLRALQTLGTRIKTEAKHAKAGQQAEGKVLAEFERTLARLRDSAAADPQLERKYQAIALLFGNLKHQTDHPAPTPAKPDKATRAQVDVEVVTDHHGASCANALGLSDKLPVSLVLGQAGGAHSDAWFRFQPRPGANIRITTDSEGADPALEVSSGCGASAEKLSANDDSIGLDATLSVSNAKREPLYVRLRNSGPAGRVRINVATATSTVNGSVKDAKTGFTLEDEEVALFDGSGLYVADAYTDQGGNYSIPVSSPGDYYVRASDILGWSSHVTELYPAGFCLPGSWGLNTCNLASAQMVTVANDATVSNIDFALSEGQRIAGQVRDTSNQPLGNVTVYLFDESSNELESAFSDDFGRYAFTALPPHSYKIQAQASGYGSQMFNHIDCAGPLHTDCDIALAASLVIANQDATSVDFSLPLLASIQGTVFNVIETSPPQYFPQIQVLDTNGNTVVSGSVDSLGHYIVGPVGPGNYYVEASSNGFFAQIFNGIDCASDCSQERASATQVTITTVGQQAQADFHLDPLPVVQGHVQDAASGLPLVNVSVQISPSPPPSPGGFWWFPTNSASTDASGNYTLVGTPPGQYYVWALSDDHIDQLYPGISCEGIETFFPIFAMSCDTASATLLTIALGQTPGTFDFALDASSSISGQALTRAGVGSDLAANDSYVSIYDSNGTEIALSQLDGFGNYVIPDLPAATYFAYIQGENSTQYIPQLWQQVDCVTACAPTTGTPVPVAASTVVSGIDFDLTRLDAVVGRVTNSNGDPISGALVDLFDSSTGIYQSTRQTDAQGYYAVPGYLDTGYFIATEAGKGYVDQIYSGVLCPLGPAYFGACPFTNATAVTLDGSATEPHLVNFVLQSNDPIFANGFE